MTLFPIMECTSYINFKYQILKALSVPLGQTLLTVTEPLEHFIKYFVYSTLYLFDSLYLLNSYLFNLILIIRMYTLHLLYSFGCVFTFTAVIFHLYCM